MMAPAGGVGVESERYCMPFGRLGRRPGDGSENDPAEVGDTSSKRSSTTTFVSVRLRLNDMFLGEARPVVLFV
jgi:hypothetical protein